MKKHKIGLYLLEIFGGLLGILYIFPFYILGSNALKTKKNLLIDLLGLPNPVVFQNFAKAISKMNFLTVFSNSIIVTVGSVLSLIIFSSMAAWVLVRTKNKTSNFVFYSFIAAMLIPFQSVMLPLVMLMGKLNMLNSYVGIIFMYLGFGSSMSLFLFHGFIKTIPVSLEEAATIDGCPRYRMYWEIILPLLKPITVTIAILNTLWIWNDFLLPTLVLQQREYRTIPLQIAYFFGQFSSDWHLAMAALTISITPVIIFYLFMQRQIIKGVTAGSFK
jgi:raffinose/stachyose/melibiose transport system permease protein